MGRDKGNAQAQPRGSPYRTAKVFAAGFCLCFVVMQALQAQSTWLAGVAAGSQVVSKAGLLPEDGEYPDQDDSVKPSSADALTPEDREKEREAVISAALSDGDTSVRGIRVPELGGLYIENGEEYMQAPMIEVPAKPMSPLSSYKGLWPLQRMHEEFFRKSPGHKKMVPRLGQNISRAEFHRIFRRTSTPVILPYRYMRHLGFATRGYTVQELRERFPWEPNEPEELAMKRKQYHVRGAFATKKDIPWGPAMWKLEKDAPVTMAGKALELRSVPRNMLLKPKQLMELNISYPPFEPETHFQPPTLWFGSSTSDTKLHADCCDNWAGTIAGTKRWFIAPPTDTRKLMPVQCSGKNKGLCWSKLRMPLRDRMTPELRAVKESLEYIVADVHAGEMLYLPSGWWHHIVNLTPTIMANFWLKSCTNSQVALDKNSKRPDRPDFASHDCPKVAQDLEAFVQAIS